MIYDIEVCPICRGGELFGLCPNCGGTGKIRTPVEFVEMWAVFNKKGDIVVSASDESRVWWLLQQEDAPDMSIDSYVKYLKKQGYTCEQVDVIRRKP